MQSLNNSFLGSKDFSPYYGALFLMKPTSFVKLSEETSILSVKDFDTYNRPSSVQSPNQSITHLLNKAGLLAVLF